MAVAAAILAAACSGSALVDSMEERIEAPALVSCSVGQGATGVSTSPTIALEFTVDMNEASLRASVGLEHAGVGAVESGLLRLGDRSFVLVPSTPLHGDNLYVVIIDAGARSKSLVPLGAESRIVFTTTALDLTPPALLLVVPADGNSDVHPRSGVTLLFDEAMDGPSVVAAFSLKDGSGARITGSSAWYGNALVFTPDSPLDPLSAYTVSLGAGSRDLAGNAMPATAAGRFRTGGSYAYERGVGSLNSYVFRPSDVSVAERDGRKRIYIVGKDSNSVRVYETSLLPDPAELSFCFAGSWMIYYEYTSGETVYAEPSFATAAEDGSVYLGDLSANLCVARLAAADGSVLDLIREELTAERYGASVFPLAAARRPGGGVSVLYMSGPATGYSWQSFGRFDLECVASGKTLLFDHDLMNFTGYNSIAAEDYSIAVAPGGACYYIAQSRFMSNPPNYYVEREDPEWWRAGRTRIGESGAGTDRYQRPAGLAVSPGGEVYVSDSKGSKLLVYGSDGVYLRTIGGPGSALGSFSSPSRLAVDGDGLVYVVDRGNFRVQVLKATGEPICAIGNESGGRAGLFGAPTRVRADSTGERIYVLDGERNEVQVFDGDFAWLRTLSGGGSPFRAFASVQELAVGPGGAVYVFDAKWDSGGWVYVFDREMANGDAIPLEGCFSISSAAVDAAGRIYTLNGAQPRDLTRWNAAGEKVGESEVAYDTIGSSPTGGVSYFGEKYLFEGTDSLELGSLDAQGGILRTIRLKFPAMLQASLTSVNAVVEDGRGGYLLLMGNGADYYDEEGAWLRSVVEPYDSQYNGPSSACFDAKGRLLLAYYDRRAVYAFAPAY